MWIEPKTDWKLTDFFNVQDYNRIKGNITEIRDQALELWPDFTLDFMGADKVYGDYYFADEINALENNLEHICQNTYPFVIGDKQEFYPNTPFIDWLELNRVESACKLIYSNITGRIEGRARMAFSLGNRRQPQL